MTNIAEAVQRRYPVFAVFSVSRHNVHDIENTLRLCDQLGMRYVNVHYVVNCGFATKDTVLSPDEWQRACDRIRRLSRDLSLDVRIERTFEPVAPTAVSCAVPDVSNLMFLPDRRVYVCPLFMDIPDSHSFVWSQEGLAPHESARRESQLCAASGFSTCPAIALINPDVSSEAERSGLRVTCVLEKSRLRHGLPIVDRA